MRNPLLAALLTLCAAPTWAVPDLTAADVAGYSVLPINDGATVEVTIFEKDLRLIHEEIRDAHWVQLQWTYDLGVHQRGDTCWLTQDALVSEWHQLAFRRVRETSMWHVDVALAGYYSDADAVLNAVAARTALLGQREDVALGLGAAAAGAAYYVGAVGASNAVTGTFLAGGGVLTGSTGLAIVAAPAAVGVVAFAVTAAIEEAASGGSWTHQRDQWVYDDIDWGAAGLPAVWWGTAADVWDAAGRLRPHAFWRPARQEGNFNGQFTFPTSAPFPCGEAPRRTIQTGAEIIFQGTGTERPRMSSLLTDFARALGGPDASFLYVAELPAGHQPLLDANRDDFSVSPGEGSLETEVGGLVVEE